MSLISARRATCAVGGAQYLCMLCGKQYKPCSSDCKHCSAGWLRESVSVCRRERLSAVATSFDEQHAYLARPKRLHILGEWHMTTCKNQKGKEGVNESGTLSSQNGCNFKLMLAQHQRGRAITTASCASRD
eukprot:5802350-Pleurochrysis_carterae.AAC.3